MEEGNFEELLCAMFLVTDEERSSSDYDVDVLCQDKLGVSFDEFVRVGQALLPLTVPSQSPVTSSWYHAFLVDGIAYVKEKSEM
ncbi:hypothetical protein AZH90_004367 [Salmonella enterica subsp. enterica serovar Legon]|nr:hypothetical protein [Salmonella enterica subsp. enterica serovar Weybridge]EDS6807095.1 hypothetical protein [Salmonella enterica subsp. enterica serovar Legon]EDW9825511.1 hypothetical protein [Salmonella enterica]EHL5833770.1 hypothetical protein [Salmonella enterica]